MSVTRPSARPPAPPAQSFSGRKPSMTSRPSKKDPFVSAEKGPNELVRLYIKCQFHHVRTSKVRSVVAEGGYISIHNTGQVAPVRPSARDERGRVFINNDGPFTEVEMKEKARRAGLSAHNAKQVWFLSCLILVVANVLVGLTHPDFPWGVLALPLMMSMYHLWRRKEKQYQKALNQLLYIEDLS